MKSTSQVAFAAFRLSFLAFSFAFMLLWNSTMTGDTVGEFGIWEVRAAFILILICGLTWVSNSKTKIHGIHLVCLLWVIIMPIIMYINGCSVGDTTLMILWPLLFEMTYLICYRDDGHVRSLRNLYVIIAIIGSVFFIQSRLDITSQTNTIYFCFLTLPWLLYGKGKRTRLLLMVLFSALAILSLKRGMLLTTVLMWMFYYFERVKVRRNLLYVGTGFLALLLVVSLSYDRIDDALGGRLTERITREETDSGKDRMAIWELTMSMIQNSPTEKLIEGHGYGGVRKNSFLEISAHNDFLEVIYDYGLIIFALYLCLWGFVLRRCYFLFKHKSPLFLPYAVSLSIFIVMSMVSMLLPYATYFNFLVMFWGMTEAYVETPHPQVLKRKR